MVFNLISIVHCHTFVYYVKMAAAFNKFKVAALRQMCIDNGIDLDDTVKYTKKQFITLLTNMEVSGDDETQSGNTGEALGDSADVDSTPKDKDTSLKEGEEEANDSEIPDSEVELDSVSALKL